MIPAARVTVAATVAGITAALIAGATGAVPASAAERGDTLVSLDGLHFSSAPSGSIFAEDVPLTPGSTLDGRFWVRNDSKLAASLSVAVSGATATTPAFIEALALRAGVGDNPATTAVPLGTAAAGCVPLLQGEVLEPGETAEVRLALAMSAAAGNAEQGATADARRNVALTDARAPLTAPDCRTVDSVALTGTATGPDDPVAVASTTTAGGTAGELTRDDAAAPDTGSSLPTMPVADEPSLLPVGIAGAAVAALLLLLVVLRLRKRRPNAQQ